MSDHSDDEANETTRQKKTSVGIDWVFLKKPSGYILLINMLMAFISMCVITSWLARRHDRALNFFAYSTTHTWVAILIIVILRLARVPRCCSFFNWTLMYLINSAIFVVIMVVGSIIVLVKFIAFIHDCSYYSCATLGVSFVLGMITTIGCMLQCRFDYFAWKAE